MLASGRDSAVEVAQSGYFLCIDAASSRERRYGGRTAEERRSERRERLLDAGLHQFGTVGYAGSTIEGLCGEASLNARYFYEQFRSREELLSAVYARHVWSVLDRVRRALEETSDPAVRLKDGLRAFVETMLADERGARIVYLEIVGVSAALEQERRRVRSDYVDMIAGEAVHQAQMNGRSADERRAIAVALVGATDGLVIDWLAGERRRSRTAIVDTLLTIFEPTLG